MCSLSVVWGYKQHNTVNKRLGHCIPYDNPDTNTGHGSRACGVTKIQSSDCGAGMKLKLSGHANQNMAGSYDHTNQEGKDKAAGALMGVDVSKCTS